MKNFTVSLKLLFFMSVLLGLVYPGFITLYAQVFAEHQANGSLLKKQEQLIGSELLGQNFNLKKYFWPRPSAIEYNSASSAASNQGPTSEALKKQYDNRTTILKNENPEAKESVPQDLLFASGSGLDPHISPEGAKYQAARVAKARNLDLGKVLGIVAQMTERPQFGIFGEPRVNVLKLNLALDQITR